MSVTPESMILELILNKSLKVYFIYNYIHNHCIKVSNPFNRTNLQFIYDMTLLKFTKPLKFPGLVDLITEVRVNTGYCPETHG